MEIGYDKFNNKDGNPMHALEHFEQIGYIPKLIEAPKASADNLDEQLKIYYEQLLKLPPEEPVDPEKPKRRVRRTFE